MLGSIESRLPQRSVFAIDLLVVLWTASGSCSASPSARSWNDWAASARACKDTGHAIDRAGDAVGQLSDVPLVGEGFGSLANEIHEIGNETAEHGLSVEEDMHRLALLIGVGLAPDRRCRSSRFGSRRASRVNASATRSGSP